MNLHDWIDEVCDILDIDAEVDEALVLDLARVCAHSVERMAAPISTFLLGYAAARRDASPEQVEELAGRVQALAEHWDGREDPAEEIDVTEVDEAELNRLVDAETD